MKKPIIGITLGDPAGIGPEVVAKSLRQPAIAKLANFVLIGDKSIYQRYSSKIPAKSCFLDLKQISFRDIRLGQPNRHSASASLVYLNEAIRLLKQRKINALVTAPVCKEAITDLGQPFHGHTEFLADAFRIKDYDMMFVTKTLRTVIVTRHLAIKDIPKALSKDKILKTIKLTNISLQKYFGIRKPRIGVAGLNPHAGEGGTIGKEELTAIIPAIKSAKEKGIRIAGPLAADTLFTPTVGKEYDCVIAMYHDQGLIPIKTLYFRNVVNLTVGLPFIRTSPAHGTAFNIAGKNKADPSSMSEAIRLAAALKI
jgi:4-hydroxythreonine-4-phosphate dehydrogenase